MREPFNFIIVVQLTIVILFLSSCDKLETRSSAQTGEFDNSFIYQEFFPPKMVELSWDTTLVGRGSDSIDMDLDGNFDVIISQQLNKNPDYNGYNGPYTNYFINTSNNFETAIKKCSYPAGFGYTATVSWVDTIHYKSNIEDLETWSEEKEHILMWSDNPEESMISKGPWSMFNNQELYVGIRRKNSSKRKSIIYKYGWIKVNIITKEELIFESCAFEN